MANFYRKSGIAMDIYETINQMRIERKRIEDIPMRVTYYARVSTMREEQDSSIEAQISHFTEMISKNPNWTYVEGYVDRVRGESADNRLQFQQMIDDGYNGMFDLILTKEVSRFARNTIDSLTYTRELLKHGVGVFFLTDNICTVEQDSELRLTIMSSIAQDEVRKLSERVKFGHKKSIESGHVLGNSRIFGYDKKDSRLYINEYEAEMIRLIFETYATGECGLKYIEDLLWEKGYRNRNGKRINHNTIGGIIQNPKYKGYYCGNKVKIIDYRTKTQKFLPEDEWVMYKDETGEIVPAIVSEELWEKANKIFSARSQKVKEAGRSAKTTSPLSGKIICGQHNEPFWRSSYSERLHPKDSIYQWICRTKKRGRSCDCSTIAIYEHELYSILGRLIIDLTKNIDTYIDEFVEFFHSSIKNNKSATKISEIERELEAAEKKKERLLDLYTDDTISKNEFKQRNDALQSTITELKRKLTSLQKNNSEQIEVGKNLLKIKNLINDFSQHSKAFEATGKDEPNPSIQKEYIDDICSVLVDCITVFPIDKTTMRLEVKLKLGETVEAKYEKPIRSSGHIFLKMNPKLRTGNTYYTPSGRPTMCKKYGFEVSFLRESIKHQPQSNIVYKVYVAV